MNDLFIDQLKKIMQLQNNPKLDDLECTAKEENITNSVNTLCFCIALPIGLPIVFLRDIHICHYKILIRTKSVSQYFKGYGKR